MQTFVTTAYLRTESIFILADFLSKIFFGTQYYSEEVYRKFYAVILTEADTAMSGPYISSVSSWMGDRTERGSSPVSAFTQAA